MITENKKEGPFYINYSRNGEHYIIGPYSTRSFAMSHIDEVRNRPDVNNVYLGNKGPAQKDYRKVLPITAILAAFSFAAICLAGAFDNLDVNFNPRSDAIKAAYHIVGDDIFL